MKRYKAVFEVTYNYPREINENTTLFGKRKATIKDVKNALFEDFYDSASDYIHVSAIYEVNESGDRISPDITDFTNTPIFP